MTDSLIVSRRVFLRAAASTTAGLVIGLYLPTIDAAQPPPGKTPVNPFNAWIEIASDGLTTIFMPKSEMGQGVMTSLPMILAEELDVDWKTVRVKQAPTNPDLYRHGTGGSTSVFRYWMPLRRAGAAARMMLIMVAAQSWNVSPYECSATLGVVRHKPTNRTSTYAELAHAASMLPVPDLDQVPLKSAEAFGIVNHDTHRVDSAMKVNGSARYGIDSRVPGMMFAAIARPKTFGSRVASVDSSSAKLVAGVQHILTLEPLPAYFTEGGVAVAADNSWSALQGRDALKIQWDPGPHASESTESLRQQFRKLAEKPGLVVRNDGDANRALDGTTKTLHAEYELPFAAHATMEPMNCTVDIRKDSAEAWVPTQDSADACDTIAKIAGLPTQAVTVHTTFMGGGFGRRSMADYVAEAAQLSKGLMRPIQVLWSREDDLQHGFYRPASHHKLAAALDEQNNLIAWKHFLSSPSISVFLDPPDSARPAATEIGGAGYIPYATPNYQVEYALAQSGVPRTWWRSVEESSSGFVVECFVDELAHFAGEDPLQFRLRLMGDSRKVVRPAFLGADKPLETDRLKNVLLRASSRAGWQAGPKKNSLGIAAFYSYRTYVAMVAQVAVAHETVRVERVFVAVDCGQPINPLGVRMQAESAVIYGLTACIKGPITIKNGGVEQSNFHDYEMLRMNEAPEIEVDVVTSREEPTGVGEPVVPVVAPAVCNAIFAATGQRIRTLPVNKVASSS
ncbi:MAG TPA: molybdopterin cofactor-binding domain-containing protein [Terriglobales bacterium]|nr:molybdopterin cofactor-binding domain-containing protein [Terriglobales bacterium]